MTLFDLADQPPDRRPNSRDRPWTVAELHDTVGALIESSFPERVWIDGEIRDIKRHRNGNVYFNLVDADEDGDIVAVLPVALFRWHKDNVNEQLRRTGSRVRMDDGIKVRLRGDITFYSRQSRLQLKMTAIDPAFTLGDLAARRAALLGRLREEGLADAQARLTLPLMPLRIALITSAGSAAEADFCDEIDGSGLAFRITRLDARVQGDQAVESIVRRLHRIDPATVDAIVIIRGGGAQTDLMAFDHEDVARAIASTVVPVIVGIGHEVDDTVADAVAHVSVKTPTAAAALLVSRANSSQSDLETLVADAVARTVRRIDTASVFVETAAARTAVSGSRRLDQMSVALDRLRRSLGEQILVRLTTTDQTLDQLARTLSGRAYRRLDTARAALDTAELTARASDPIRLLQRGWTLTTTADGRAVDLSHVETGMRLRTRHAGGSIISSVESSTATPPRPATTRDERGDDDR